MAMENLSFRVAEYLGTFPSPYPSSAASAVSADGTFVAGPSNVNNEYIEAFRWAQGTGLPRGARSRRSHQ